MIVYGWNSKEIDVQDIDVPCTECGNTDQTLVVIQKYGHIFWLPTIPLGKDTILECRNCRLTYYEKEMPEAQKEIAKKARKGVSTPLTMFAGLALLILIFAGSIGIIAWEERKTGLYISEPAVDDFAVIRTDKGDYQVIKIVSIKGDQVEMVMGNYAYDRLSGAKNAIKKDFTSGKGYFYRVPTEISVLEYKKLPPQFVFRPD